jgi:hypothetical protein
MLRLTAYCITQQATIVRHRNVYRHGFEFAQPLVGIFRKDAVTGDLYLEQGNRELQK